ncbi:hypothetical protein SAMN03159496_05877 [Rhizobium sp. NFR07]|nr:hypothetical protein SAMN03159496_05877 [Rhizobium sp. NFR07]
MLSIPPKQEDTIRYSIQVSCQVVLSGIVFDLGVAHTNRLAHVDGNYQRATRVARPAGCSSCGCAVRDARSCRSLPNCLLRPIYEGQHGKSGPFGEQCRHHGATEPTANARRLRAAVRYERPRAFCIDRSSDATAFKRDGCPCRHSVQRRSPRGRSISTTSIVKSNIVLEAPTASRNLPA